MRLRITTCPAFSFAVLFVGLYCAPLTSAQVSGGGSYALTQQVVAGGGAISSGGSLVVVGTIAQHDVGTVTGGTYILEGGFWPEGETFTAPPACGFDVTSQLSITRSAFSIDLITHRFQQSVTLRNDSSTAITTPLAYVVDGLTPGVTLFKPAGETTCAAPKGSSYVNVTAGGDSKLAPGESVTVLLEFVISGTVASISYTPRVLTGNAW